MMLTIGIVVVALAAYQLGVWVGERNEARRTVASLKDLRERIAQKQGY